MACGQFKFYMPGILRRRNRLGLRPNGAAIKRSTARLHAAINDGAHAVITEEHLSLIIARLPRFVGFFVLAYALLAAAAWLLVSRAAGPHVFSETAELAPARAGLVLGASPKSRGGAAPNSYFVHRIAAAATLYKSGKVEFLIVSGDKRDDGYDEPTAMRDALVAEGVPAAHIYRDAAGFHTRNSLARAHLIFGLEDAIVISQRFHAERAVFIARAHGLRFTGYAAEDVDAYFGLLTLARETFSRIVALVDALSPEPAPKGENVSLGKDAPT